MFTDQGVIEGDAHVVNQFKSSLNSYVEIYADVFVKHAVPPPGSKIENHANELIHRAGADVVIVTGDGTGHEINLEDLVKVIKIDFQQDNYYEQIDSLVSKDIHIKTKYKNTSERYNKFFPVRKVRV